MRLTLKHIRWRNFLATGNTFTEIDLNESQTTLIVGINGSGKSTLLDALFFVLFNRPFRKINKPQLVNTITNKDCMVECELEANGYEIKVIRGIKPNIFKIWKNGELITQDADTDYQDAFERYILKVTHKTLSQIVVLGSAIFVSFMALPTPARRAIIEDLLDLEIFTKMNALLKERLDNCDTKLRDTEENKKLLNERKRLSEEHIKTMSESQEKLIQERQDIIKKLTAAMMDLSFAATTLSKQCDDIDKKLIPLDDLNSKKQEMVQIRSELNQKTKIINRELLFFANNEMCPTCRQHIKKTHKEKIVEEDTKTVNECSHAIQKLDTRIQSIDNKLAEIATYHQESQTLRNLILEKTVKYEEYDQNCKDIKKSIELIKTETYQIDFSKLEEIKQELAGIEAILLEISENRTIMGYAAVLLKDSGIKAKIVKSFLPAINQLIQKYLAALDFFVEFHLDEQFNETILSRHRDNFSYESFSEGEKMRLNLGILFAWRAIAKLRGSIDCNLLILDELLDSSLDAEGIDNVLRVISSLTMDNNVFIISHKTDLMSDKFSKVIAFEKVNNFSKVVESHDKRR